jgi:hypothetical protein
MIRSKHALLTAGLLGLLAITFAASAPLVLAADAPEILYSGRRSEEGAGRVHL